VDDPGALDGGHKSYATFEIASEPEIQHHPRRHDRLVAILWTGGRNGLE
jgi:hypothetical protein